MFVIFYLMLFLDVKQLTKERKKHIQQINQMTITIADHKQILCFKDIPNNS